MLHCSGFGGRAEEWRVGDYPAGFIVIADLLKNTDTVCIAYGSTPPSTERIRPYTLGGMSTQRGCTCIAWRGAHITEVQLI